MMDYIILPFQGVGDLMTRTPERCPSLQPTIEPQLYAYMGDTIKRVGGIPHLINGTCNHIHLLSSLPRTPALSKYIEEIKRNSSRWIKTKHEDYQKFAWQNGYGAFSVSNSQRNTVMRYLAEQKEHHRHVTFKKEFLAFLEKYHVEHNDQYLWD